MTATTSTRGFTMRRLFPALAVLAAAITVPAGAQSGYGGIAYNVSFPLSDTKDFADAISFRGISAEFGTIRSESLRLSIFTGWHVFANSESGTVEVPEVPGAVTGDFATTINSFPILAGLTWMAPTNGKARPYLSAHAGTYYVKRRVEVGLFAVDDDAWHFGASPAAGVQFSTDRGVFFLEGRYHWTAAAKDRSEQYVTIGVGYRSR